MKNYKIITLGPSGAGKTVFLASLFKKLAANQEGAFLKTFDDQQRIKLNQIYAKIIDPDQNWPSGTRDITQITFTCYVKNLDLNPQNFQVCDLTYIDYSGGLITDKSDEEDVFDFQENVPNADAVLAIIDGLKLLKLMQGENLNNETITKFLHIDLTNMMQLINQYQTDKPVNFIISKWDLLEGRYNLSQIRERLLEKVPEFENVVNFRVSAGCPVRLIPVSSIGMDFATLEPDGSMTKTGAIPKPLYLEIPIAYLLIDKVGDREKAHNHLVVSFKKHLKDFEKKFPEANLAKIPTPICLILTQAILLILVCSLVFQGWSILCLPFGIVAIVYAAKAKAPLKLGSKLGRKQASKNAKKWFLFGFIPAAIIAMIIRFS
ncbi:CD225/dispanin family protein [Dapis sp. BLCC M126]|uniref:CD225/dispanin family protein n=1 Tax=Dapis sp. BLCC M126 TaxID=3400189 RepID=UPI003CE9BB6C